ncbi:MAG: hypothetical protein ABIH25_02935 [Candidatus Woesearchaeota archaeon]
MNTQHVPENPQMPEIPEAVIKKQKELKEKLGKLEKKILKSYKKDVVGIALLPPRKVDPEMVKKGLVPPVDKNQIDIFIALNDNKSKVQPDYKLKDSVAKELVKITKEIDKHFFLDIMLMSEIKEALFDSKYEILQDIAMSLIIYDPVDFLGALKISEVHKNMVIRKFDKYILSYVAAGSLFRGEKSNDIDVYVVIDDTDVKRMSRIELKDKLRGLIVSMGFEAAAMTGVKKQFHVQTYILTDFWESVKDAHPVIFTLLRDGIPIYDRGVFMPWRLLLNMGRIRPSPEAIDMQMNMGESLIKRAKQKMLLIASEDLYYAVLNPSQAALMLYGVTPPTPKETVKLMEEIFVKKEKILEQTYVNTLEKLRLFFKDMEHGKLKEVTGAELDKILNDSENYLKRIKKLFDQIERKKEKENLGHVHSTILKVTEDSILEGGIKNYKSIEAGFRKFCDKEGLPVRLVDDFKMFEKAYKDFKAKKLTKAEGDMIKREGRTFIRTLTDHIQRKQFSGVERSKIRFKHKKKLGEMLLLEGLVFITEDIGAKKKIIKKADIVDGRLKNIKDSDIIEMDDALVKFELPKHLSIKEGLFEDLKKMYGDVEILF